MTPSVSEDGGDENGGDPEVPHHGEHGLHRRQSRPKVANLRPRAPHAAPSARCVPGRAGLGRGLLRSPAQRSARWKQLSGGETRCDSWGSETSTPPHRRTPRGARRAAARRPGASAPATSRGKRALDLVLVLGTAPVTVPLGLLTAVLVKLTSRGPVLFGQERVGLGGERFTMYKFRTMHRDAERLLQQDPGLWSDYVTNGYKVPAELDRRITPLGRFLRRSSLDELPQIINVLTGQMSLVGPRPVVPEEVENYGDQRTIYLSVRPGITGAWQVNGRSTVDYPDRVTSTRTTSAPGASGSTSRSWSGRRSPCSAPAARSESFRCARTGRRRTAGVCAWPVRRAPWPSGCRAPAPGTCDARPRVARPRSRTARRTAGTRRGDGGWPPASLVGELTVEVAVQLVECVLALGGGIRHGQYSRGQS